MSQPHAIIEILEDAPVNVIEIRDPRRIFVEVEQPNTEVVNVVTAGPIGPRGPQGLPGPEGKLRFEEFHFASPTMEWVMHHLLDMVPVVTLYDLNDDEISADVATPDMNTVIVSFQVPMAGRATLKA